MRSLRWFCCPNQYTAISMKDMGSRRILIFFAGLGASLWVGLVAEASLNYVLFPDPVAIFFFIVFLPPASLTLLLAALGAELGHFGFEDCDYDDLKEDAVSRGEL